MKKIKAYYYSEQKFLSRLINSLIYSLVEKLKVLDTICIYSTLQQ